LHRELESKGGAVAEAAATAGQESADLFGRVCGIVQPESVVILFFVANPWLKMWLKFSGGDAAGVLDLSSRHARSGESFCAASTSFKP